ncbi:ABC transporter permease [Actinomadura rubrisoli]|uniref:ABC transporter permease n=1 Tax=Actinomadura rubrisoli TaxID=2530368 RepID=A0A4R4ZU41_9ACTN|nr:ABC transporter permease [Actinomadura rubrisoli]TDD62623.1 ABC transporter permease [Actinomadura rubrisoli]
MSARRAGLLAAVAVLAFLAVCAVAPGLVTSRGPEAADPAGVLQAPSAAHPFGTDEVGRDVFARVVHGARVSLATGALATLFGLTTGALAGTVAGFAGRAADAVLMRIVDLLMGFPALLLALFVVAVIGRGTVHIAIAVGVAEFAGYARLTRAEVLRVRSREYVEAARASGLPGPLIAWRHVLPNAVQPVLSAAAIGVGVSMLASSSLSFLGFGPPPPAPEWGGMVAGARDYVALAWWTAAFPGLAVVATILSVRRIGRGTGLLDR